MGDHYRSLIMQRGSHSPGTQFFALYLGAFCFLSNTILLNIALKSF